MQIWINDTARDLLDHPAPGGPLTLDEIAACAGITTRQLWAYYNSVEAIVADIPARPSHVGRC
ncbi:hypothetical protein [Amycolatopsis nalaikhensis]|uniref:HTH tetR-type domain-containing protein n=1 Tax=Amycolatopsis nalaikhensis TaxID=715472 RepID=A0ABY8XYJ6_9PSEU|nr:hypothetical protein [Amycolatopsis sp. 2-2]WIV60616.1 hypothetical protein QP939_19420 [Amycolatopsis sp. 2-2]